MRTLMRQKKGQFIIIAVLIIAIMIVSIGALLQRAVVYYKHEPWEEYLTLIEGVELNSQRLMEISLVNFTQTSLSESTSQNILQENLNNWTIDLRHIYPGRGVIAGYTLENGTAYNYTLGLARSWNNQTSLSTAKATFELDINSIGLSGYEFTIESLLTLEILNATGNEINVVVRGIDQQTITNLEEENFKVEDRTITNLLAQYDPEHVLVYTIVCDSSTEPPFNPNVTVWDHNGIRVVASM